MPDGVIEEDYRPQPEPDEYALVVATSALSKHWRQPDSRPTFDDLARITVVAYLRAEKQRKSDA